jgi:hypothetical protein
VVVGNRTYRLAIRKRLRFVTPAQAGAHGRCRCFRSLVGKTAKAPPSASHLPCRSTAKKVEARAFRPEGRVTFFVGALRATAQPVKKITEEMPFPDQSSPGVLGSPALAARAHRLTHAGRPPGLPPLLLLNADKNQQSSSRLAPE